MASIYKRDIKGKRSSIYLIDYTDERGERRTVSGFRDKAASRAKAQQLEARVERIQAGLPVDNEERLKAPIQEALDAYAADLARKGRSKRHQDDTRKALLAATQACGFKILAQIRPDKLTAHLANLAAQGRGARTQNYVRDAVSAFCRFCVSQGWMSANPVERVPRLSTRGKNRRYRRRALTLAEFESLMRTAPEVRVAAYAVAGLAGLRRSEVARLIPGDCELGNCRPRWCLRPEVSKSGEAEHYPMLPDCVPWVQALAFNKGPREKLFKSTPRHYTVRKDFERAGIALRDGQGRAADFHSLRYFYCTQLAKRLPIQHVRLLMRHRSIMQTVNTYLDLGIEDVEEAAVKAPRILEESC